MTQEEFLELVEATCKRPAMYTPTGSFFEIVSFLDGYGSAALEGQGYHSSFTPFQKWLAEKFDRNPQFPLSWQNLREHFDSDEDALRNFPSLYGEYLRVYRNKYDRRRQN